MSMKDPSKSLGQEYFIVTLNGGKNNRTLLTSEGEMRPGLRRNIDYAILPKEAWARARKDYDMEIKATGVYPVCISFICYGRSTKTTLVHGEETVFDVVLTLFVNKMFGKEEFCKMFTIKKNGTVINPFTLFKDLVDNRMPEHSLLNNDKFSGSSSVVDDKMSDHSSGGNNEHHASSTPSTRNIELEIADEENVITIPTINITVERTKEPQIENSKYEEESISSSASLVSNSKLVKTPAMYMEAASSRGCVGLPNLGNTCFMNSALQCLANCPGFREYFLSERALSAGNVVSCWAALLAAMERHEPASTAMLKTAMGERNKIYKRYDEQDSFEFINIFLDALHESLKKMHKCVGDKQTPKIADYNENIQTQDAYKKANAHEMDNSIDSITPRIKEEINRFWNKLLETDDTIVSRTFYGLSSTVFKCITCGHTHRKIDPFMTLSLPIALDCKYHPSITLVFESSRLPLRVLAPINLSVRDLVSYVSERYSVRGHLWPAEYRANVFYQQLALNSPAHIAKAIFLFEYRPGVPYFICSLTGCRLFFFKNKMGVDFLVPVSTTASLESTSDDLLFYAIHGPEDFLQAKAAIFARLEPFVAQPITQKEFFNYVSVTSGNSCAKPFFMSLSVSSPLELFGQNLPILQNPPPAPSIPPITLQTCLDAFLREEVVSLYCDVCKQSVPHRMGTQLSKLPQILIIQFKRLAYQNGMAKINTPVDFPDGVMELENAKYRLIGTCNHIEIGMGYGHYLAYIRRNKEWYSCNDLVISKNERIDKRTAYILFYKLI